MFSHRLVENPAVHDFNHEVEEYFGEVNPKLPIRPLAQFCDQTTTLAPLSDRLSILDRMARDKIEV